MRRQKVMSVGEIFNDLIQKQGLSQGLERIRVFEAWNEVVGEKLAALTIDKYYKDGRLVCVIGSSVAKNELFMRRIEIADNINSKLGSQVLKHVIIK